jgi:hypothetical protein
MVTSRQQRLVKTTRDKHRRQICHAEMEQDPRVKVQEQVGVLAVVARAKARVKARAKVKARGKARDAVAGKAVAADRVARDVARGKVVVKAKDKAKAKVWVADRVEDNPLRPPRIRPRRGTSPRPQP